MAGLPAAQRAHVEGVDVLAHRRAAGGRTTSLPETPQGERNWDYRYAWVRDSTFALWGLYTLGLDREADDFFAFIADVSGANSNERHPLQVMYGVGGERSLVEEELHHLSGYDHARPVRIGNGAYDQVQHDIWGSILDSFYLHAKSREQIPESLWPVLKKQVEEAVKHWREPDRGHLGGSRRTAALHLVEGDVLGGARPRGEAGRAAGREELRPAVAGHRRGDQGRHPRNTGWTPAGCSPSAMAATRWTPRCCWWC